MGCKAHIGKLGEEPATALFVDRRQCAVKRRGLRRILHRNDGRDSVCAGQRMRCLWCCGSTLDEIRMAGDHPVQETHGATVWDACLDLSPIKFQADLHRSV